MTWDAEIINDARLAALRDLGPCEATLDGEHYFIDLAAFTEKCEECEAILEYLGRTPMTKERLEYLRSQIRDESISWHELAELQSLASEIDPSDTELLEWAGVEENEAP